MRSRFAYDTYNTIFTSKKHSNTMYSEPRLLVLGLL